MDFKQELLNNTLCIISLMQWNNLVERAEKYLESKRFKLRKCEKMDSDKYYNIAKDTLMGKQHLIAVLIRCNDDILQRKFAETYRKLSKDELVSSVIKRHSNFANLGRYLRECIELFGCENGE
eukprot:250905_1